MQIHNHLSPVPFGQGSRPDHAGAANGQAKKFAEAAAVSEAPDATEPPATITPTDETEALDIPGKSVAHRARHYISQLVGLEGHSFGWVVSQIARGTFDIAAYTSEAGSDESADSVDGADATTSETTTEAEDGSAATSDTASDMATEDPTEDTVADLLDATAGGSDDNASTGNDTGVDPVVDLVDALLGAEAAEAS